jgi:predicted metalloprotease with PDZ domain
MSIRSFRRSRRAFAASRRWVTLACGAGLLCCFASVARARQINVVVEPPVDSHARAFIEVIGDPVRIWSFPNSYAGVTELGNRIERLEAFDTAGAEIPVRKIAPGQFEATTAAPRFRYEVNLAPPAQISDAARVSWLTFTRGLLMLADLLPTNRSEEGKAGDGEKKRAATESAIVRVKAPDSWAVYSNENQNAAGDFTVPDVDRAVFAVGSQLRSSQVSASGMTMRLVTDGEWAFADSEALKLGADVLKIDREVFGAMPSKQGTLILLPFPQSAATSKWSAETRGSTVTLLMGKLPSKTAALSQLSVPLTHELFHLWVPNGLALDGDYDWFYEGFTVYQAARTAVRLGLLTFQEFLNAIARAFDAYAVAVDHDRWSLVEASRRRWTVGAPSVYSKSMVVAFLYDLKVRSQSRGKHSLDDAYRKTFQDYHSSDAGSNRAAAGQGTDGNEVAANALASDSSMQGFVRQFIRDPVTISLASELTPFGLRVETFGLRTRVSVSEQMSKPQRDLLRELGYNDSARSSTQKKHS